MDRYNKGVFMNEKGVSSTVVGIILLVVGLAIVLMLAIYLGTTSNNQIGGILGKMDILRGGGGV